MLKKLALVLALAVILIAVVIALALRDNPGRPTTGEARYVNNNGLRIAYFVSGPNTGETVVLQASYARSGADFNELVAELNRAGYRTLTMQARGIDGSELPSLKATLFDYADDLRAALDAEHLSAPLTLVGHAFGNRIARAFASRYPERVRSLVLLAAGDSPPPPHVQNAVFKVMFNISPESTRLSALQEAFFAPANTPPEHWLRGWYPKAGLAQGNATATTPAEQWSHGGNAPLLVIQPAFDAAAPEGAARLKQRFPQRVTVVPLANAGHALLPEQLLTVSELLLQHLARR
jgi:pimeloyl-ACP methyl ester carboxylesterase